MIGHNTSAEQLRAIIERVERLTDEKVGIADEIRDVFAEAKGNGFCVKTIRKVLKLRAMDVNKRQEEQDVLETYRAALGMLPLFEGE